MHTAYRIRHFTYSIFAVCLFLALVPLSALAQGLGLTLQPSIIEERLDPGSAVAGVLTVKNESPDTQTYYISTRDVTGMELGGQPNFAREQSDDPYAASSWLKPAQVSLSLASGESKPVPYRIEVPADASPGGYFAAFFVTRQADDITESGASVGFHVASLVNLRVNGEANEDMLFKEFSTERAFHTEPSVVFSSRIENTGTVHERPVGLVTITDMLGNEVGKATLNENGGAILPRNERAFSTTWTGKGFLLGRFTASASVVYGMDTSQTMTRDTSFWIVPVREVGTVLGGIILVLGLLILGVRSYIRRQLRRAGHTAVAARIEERSSFAAKVSRVLLWLTILVVLAVLSMVVFFA